MGARYARAALRAERGKLSSGPREVLFAMALRVLDKPVGNREAGVYYGGREMLLRDLGTLPTRTATRHLSGNVRTLVELGLIERRNVPGNGESAVYKLRLSVDNLPP